MLSDVKGDWENLKLQLEKHITKNEEKIEFAICIGDFFGSKDIFVCRGDDTSIFKYNSRFINSRSKYAQSNIHQFTRWRSNWIQIELFRLEWNKRVSWSQSIHYPKFRFLFITTT